MLVDHSFPSGALALAVLAAFAAPVHGEDFSDAVDVAMFVESEPGQSVSILGLLPPQDASLANPAFSLESMLTHPAGAVEVARAFGNAALSISVSPMSAFALPSGSVPSSSALQVSGAYQIAPRMAIAGQAAYGITGGVRGGDSLASDIARARTNAFSFGLVAADSVRRGDRLSVSLSQPMRTYSGRFAVDMLPRSGGSSATRERLVFSMVPVGREMRAQLNYQMPAGAGATFGMALMVRRNPNNLADASVETLVAARYVKPF